MATDNIGIVRQLIEEVWNKGNVAIVDNLVSDRYVGYQPIIGEVRGAQGVKQEIQMIRTAFPDLQIAIEDIGMFADRVFVRWTARGTHRGIFMGLAGTGRVCEVRGIGIDRFAGGKIVEHNETYDSLPLLQALGVVPPLEQMLKGRVGQQPVTSPRA